MATPTDDEAEVNNLALFALFLAIVWVFGAGAIAGIILGFKALAQIRDSDPPEGGRSLAIAAIITGFVGLFSFGLLIAVAVNS